MTIHLNLSNLNKAGEEKNVRVHYMPCVIRTDGEANVSGYFEPIITKEKNNEQVLKASFRGYPLQGRELKIPKNYCGIILEETRNPVTEDCDRNIYGTHKFDQFIYWNWDAEPSDDDQVVTAMDWLDIAEAVSNS